MTVNLKPGQVWSTSVSIVCCWLGKETYFYPGSLVHGWNCTVVSRAPCSSSYISQRTLWTPQEEEEV